MSKSGLPAPIVYEKEYKYWPWGKLILFINEWLVQNASKDTCIIDYMCGTGYLLNKLGQNRKDIKLYGCSITKEYIDFAQKNYRNIKVQLKDALKYIPPEKPNIIMATGGIHHLKYSEQKRFIEKVASELLIGETFLIGEEVIRTFGSDMQRRLNILEMSSAAIAYIINQNAPVEVLNAALDLQNIDMFEAGEYKLSMQLLKELLNPFFNIEDIIQIWPDNSEPFGDYILICKKK